MKKTISFIILLVISLQSHAQIIIRGVVKSDNSETLPGVSVYIPITDQHTVTDVDGKFQIQYTGTTPLTIISQFVGFKTDTLTLNAIPDNDLKIRLKKSIDLKEVEIKSRRESTSISTITPINTTTITQHELLKAACCNLSESFETNPTIDVNYSDAVTGAKQIQMLGLDGIYSQIQFQNLPLIFGLSASHGLAFTPGPWIESIQINKGIGSVINGFEAMTGQINIELKKPQNADRFFINGYLNNEGREELNLQLAQRFKKHISTVFLAHGSMNHLKVDRDKDGFLDQPLTKQVNAMNVWHITVPNKLEGEIGWHALYENRMGGQKGFNYNDDFGKSTLYGVGIENKMFEVYTKTGTINPAKPYKSIALLTLSRLHLQDNYYGNKTYIGDQRSFHANTIYQTIIHDTRNYIRSGLSFRYNHYSEKYNSVGTYTNEIIPGAYAEYSFNNDLNWAVVAGLRADIHNTYGFFLTPRLHIKYNIDQLTAIRLSAGKGWRTARVYAENTSMFTSSRALFIDDLKAEEAWNTGINFTKKMQWFGHDASFNADYYYTWFKNQVVIDMEDIHQLRFYNLDGKSFSHYLQGELNIEPINNLLLRFGYKYNVVKQTFSGELKSKPLTPRDKALLNAEYKIKKGKYSIDATLKYTGKGRIPGGGVQMNGYEVKSTSESFITLNSQATWRTKHADFYLGCENITDFRQKHAIIAADEPFGQNFDASMIWGPLMGRTFYVGFRYTIK